MNKDDYELTIYDIVEESKIENWERENGND
jgi:hypothetical protein